MRVRKKNSGGSVIEMNGCDRIGGNSEAEELFYEKLKKLNESSGLGLLFNFRQTNLDLYKFYEQVTEKGGYHQVTKENKWSTIISSMNPKGSSPLSPPQLQKIYGNLLYPFEQIHHYRTCKEIPVKLHSTPDNTLNYGDCLSCLRRKRKRKHNPNKSNTSSRGHCRAINDEDIHIELEAPVRARTAYQLFVKKECERLREINGDSSESTTSRAIKAWRELPAEDRKPFIEESKKEKERFNQEMKNYNDEKTTPVPKPRNKPNSYSNEKSAPVPEPKNYPSPGKTVVTQSKMMWPITDGDYHVTLQPAPESLDLPNESDIELATQLMKNKLVSDTVFEINLEEYWSIDFTG